MLRLAKSTAESGTTNQNQRRERGQSFVVASTALLSGLDEIRRGFGSRLTVFRATLDYTAARTGFGVNYSPYARFRRVN